MKRCFLFHDWGPWQQYAIVLPERRLSKNWAMCAVTEHRQRRTCKRCGLMKDVSIRMEPMP